MPDESKIDAGLLERGGVQLTVEGPLATVTLNRPEVLNAQTPATWDALREIGSALSDEVRVVVVRGVGRAFSAGLDRRLFTAEGFDGQPGLVSLASGSPEDSDAVIAEFQRGFTWLRESNFITVAAVHGHAIGAGFQLALACDLRVAAEDAQFAMAETSLGLVPDLGGTLPLVQCVGYARAVEICLTGRRVGAEEALRIGLVNEVVPADALDAAVANLVARLVAPMPGASRETLALLAKAAGSPSLSEQTAAERSAQLRRLAELKALMNPTGS
ncbi:enoyl-CoA hydratase/isomerase family protein [Crossiella sp. CA-258035]|uniref:enoyl-CoA hydratase/isomerase family protein n=1 Tax=Crossiella sp. CA-258035 TaxID=2981138 RepID=UPI0024BD3D10|nr:enoyl-CoA hydratase/isomerase family protein [Crossiella sp. CA-258035]WHT16913.1 enoyl-CoA hydratase/isomerase family protein [Crossiella sp. CA-258035]